MEHTSHRSSHHSPSDTPTYLLLFPLPLSISFALLPLTPLIKRIATRRRSRHKQRAPSRSQKSPPTSSPPQTKAVGQARTSLLPLQRPRLFVFVVNMRPAPTDAGTRSRASPVIFPHAFHRWTQVLCKTRPTDRGTRGRLITPVRRCHYRINPHTHNHLVP